MKFTSREIETLKKLYPEYQRGNVSMQQLCKGFNRTADSIRSAAQRYSLIIKIEESTMNEDYIKSLMEVVSV